MRVRDLRQRSEARSLNFSQVVEGRRWWPWAREGLSEAYVFAGAEPCTGEETYNWLRVFRSVGAGIQAWCVQKNAKDSVAEPGTRCR